MKKNINRSTVIIIFQILLFLFFFGTEVQAALKIFVSASGNDNNPGTKEAPLASLNGAVYRLKTLKKDQNANERVEIIIGDGEYFMTGPLVLNTNDSGTDGSPVVFKAEEGANPVFYGGKRISGFEEISENLWRAKVPEVEEFGWRFEQLYVNGERAFLAKTPNSGFYHLKSVSETVLHKATENSPELAIQKFELFPNAAKEIAQYSEEDYQNSIITFYHKWDITRNRIRTFDPDSSIAFVTGAAFKSYNKIDIDSRYKIENYRAALDTCGEWYLDREGYLFYIPKAGETINDLNVFAPIVENFIIIQGDEKTGKKVKNIRFEGLSFQVSGYQMPFYGEQPFQAAAGTNAVVMVNYAEKIEFKNCEIAHTGTNAIWFREACIESKIEHCYFHDLGAGGVKIGDINQPEDSLNLTRNIVVDNNIIRSGGFVFPVAVGVTIFHASDNEITHNEIADFRYSGVSVGWVWGYELSPSKRNKIEFNHIHHIGWSELSDMGGVYCLGSSEGTTVSNNVIHHVYSYDYGGWGLYTDEGATGIIMENNLVYNCKSAGFHQHYGKENIIQNNIFANNLKAQIQASKIEDHLSFTFTNNIVWFNVGDLFSTQWISSDSWKKINVKIDYNCYWDARTKDVSFAKYSFAEWRKLGNDKHSVIADPGFGDPSQYDFRIKDKSVLRRIGFIIFDYNQAGVYGSDEWRKLASFDHEIATRFDKAVIRNSVKGE